MEKIWVLTLPLKEVSKNLVQKRIFAPKKFGPKRFLSRKKCFPTFFCLKKILVKETFGKHNFWWKKLSQKIFCPKHLICLKKSKYNLVNRNFWFKNFFLKNFFAQKKFQKICKKKFDPKKDICSNIFWSKKFVQTNFWSKKDFDP